jgi:hypothetical protein
MLIHEERAIACKLFLSGEVKKLCTAWGCNACGKYPLAVGLQLFVEGVNGLHLSWTASVGSSVNNKDDVFHSEIISPR